jgi:hypothetical protein
MFIATVNFFFVLKSYNPDLTSDPCAEDGCLWFFNYFMYNKKMKRIVFISFRCTSKSIESSDDDDMEDENEMNLPQTSAWPYSLDFKRNLNNGNANTTTTTTTTTKNNNGINSQNKSQSVDMKPVQTVIG